MTRVYLPTTLGGLARLLDDQELPATVDRVAPDGDDEMSEYAALMTAADESASLPGGAGRRVVVVAEVADVDAAVPLRRVVAVHADPASGADPDDDLAWYAAQEIEQLVDR